MIRSGLSRRFFFYNSNESNKEEMDFGIPHQIALRDKITGAIIN